MARTHGRGGAGIRKTNKKGATKGSGGQRRKGLAGKGPTPKAEDRIYHAKHKAKLERDRRNSGRHQKETAEMVVGRNPVIECLHAKVPATTLYIVAGTRNDKRLSEAVAMCNTRNIPIIEVQRHEMDRMTGNGMHQGIGLQIPPYKYADVDELISRAAESARPGMFVILDNITDPRNLGAVILCGSFWWRRRHHPRAPLRIRDCRGVAYLGRHGGAPAGRPRDEYHPHRTAIPKERLPGRRPRCRRRAHAGYI